MGLNLRRVTTPTEPLTLAEVRRQLRFDDPTATSPQDPLLQIAMAAARETAEAFTSIALAPARFEYRLDALDVTLWLPLAPVTAIQSVTYLNTAGTQQTVSAGVYAFDDNPDAPVLRLAYGQSIPASRADFASVSITFDAGMAAVPLAIKQAMLVLIQAEYDDTDRDAARRAAEYLMQPHRRSLGV